MLNEKEHFVAEGYRVAWPNQELIDDLDKSIRSEVCSLMTYVHTSEDLLHRGARKDDEIIAIEKAMISMNKKYSDILQFIWIGGVLDTVVPSTKEMAQQNLQDVGMPCKDYWEVNKDDPEAIAIWKKFFNDSAWWCVKHHHARSYHVWDSEEQNLCVRVCAGEEIDAKET